MKKVMMIISVVAFVLTLSGCFGSEEVDNALDVFCSDNPEALVCTNPEATRNEIVANMFNTMMTEFIEGTNERFCDDYFSASNPTLLAACKNDRFSLVPEDIIYLSDDVIITAGEETNQFVVTTTYENGENGYLFTVTIVEEDGVIRFSEFSYQLDESDNEADLALTDDQVKAFMVNVINYDDQGDTYCSDLFTGNAYEACLNTAIDEFIPSIYAMYHPVVSQLIINQFSYRVESFDGKEIYLYRVTFTKVDDLLKISELSYQDISIYNSLENAKAVLVAFLNDFTNGDNLADLCEDRVIDAANIQTCKDTFSKVYNNSYTIPTFIESATGVYQATVEFKGTTTTTFTFELFIVIGDDGMYDLDLTLLSEDVSEVGKTFTLEEVNKMFTAYFTDWNLHDTYSDEQFCALYMDSAVTPDAFNGCVSERSASQTQGAYYQIHIVETQLDETNRWFVSVRAYFKDKTMQYTYDVFVYETENENVFLTYEGRTEEDVTVSLDSLNERIAVRYDDYLLDYLNAGITSASLYDEYLNENYSETAFSNMRDTYRSTINEIQISNITIGEIKDGYFLVHIDGLVDFTDPNVTDYVISQTGRVYLLYSEMMLFPLTVEANSGADPFNITTEEAEVFIMNVYDQYHNDTIDCSAFFSSDASLVTSCETDQLAFFGEESVVSVSAVATGDNHFTITRSYYNDDSVLATLPDLFVVINSYDGTLLIDTWYANEVLTPEVITSVVDDYITTLLDPTMTNTEYCALYGVDNNCETLREAILGSPTTVTYDNETVLVNGEEVEQVTVTYTDDGVIKTVTYNLDFELNQTGEYEVGTVEDALTEVTLSLSEATALFDQFVIDYNNQAMTNEQLATKYFALTVIDPLFFSERSNYFTEGAVMVKTSVEEVTGEAFYRFTYTVGTDNFINTVNLYLIVDGVYNFAFLDYVPAIPIEATLSEAEVIMTTYFEQYQNLSLTDATLCDQYYEGGVDCLGNRAVTVNANTITLISVTAKTTGEEDYFTVVYTLNGFMETRIVSWDLTLMVNPDGTYLIAEIAKVETPVETYIELNDPQFNVDEVSLVISHYYRDFYDYMISNPAFCQMYATDGYPYDGATETFYEQCVSERSAKLTDVLDNDLVKIIFDYQTTNYLTNTDYLIFTAITYGITSDSIDDKAVYAREYLYLTEDDSAFYGYTVTNYSTNDETVYYPAQAEIDTVVNQIISLYLDPSYTDLQICSIFASTEPGNPCFVDRGTYVGNATYNGYYLTYGLGFAGEFIVEINLNFVTSSNENVIVTLPMVFTEKYNSTNTWFEFDSYYYYIQPRLINEEEFNTLVTDFFNAYITASNSDATIINSYFKTGAYYITDRTTDLTAFNNHVLVETTVSHLNSWGSLYTFTLRQGEEGSYTYETYYVGIDIASDGTYTLKFEHPNLLDY